MTSPIVCAECRRVLPITTAPGHCTSCKHRALRHSHACGADLLPHEAGLCRSCRAYQAGLDPLPGPDIVVCRSGCRQRFTLTDADRLAWVAGSWQPPACPRHRCDIAQQPERAGSR